MRTQFFPQRAFASQFFPDGAEEGTTELLRLIHKERQHHEHGKHHRQVLDTVSIVVLEVVSLVLQRVERLVLDVPPRASALRQHPGIATGDVIVGDPGKATGQK